MKKSLIVLLLCPLLAWANEITDREIELTILDEQSTYAASGVNGLASTIQTCYETEKPEHKKYCGYLDLWANAQLDLDEDGTGSRLHKYVPEYQKFTKTELVNTVTPILKRMMNYAENMPEREVDWLIDYHQKKPCLVMAICEKTENGNR